MSDKIAEYENSLDEHREKLDKFKQQQKTNDDIASR